MNNNQQYEKNPNGGYLNKNQYGLYGALDVTPQLLAEIQRTGKVVVSVNQVEQRQAANGDTWESARTVLKPYTPAQQQAAAPAPVQAYAPQPQAALAPVQHAAPQHNAYGAAPAPASPGMQAIAAGGDEIPF